MNSYGLYPTNIGPALFNNKPFDYTEQSMGRGVSVSDTYNDMSSVLPQGIPFLSSLVRNVTNNFREEALGQINAFDRELQQSTEADGKRYLFRGPYRFRSYWGSHSWQHYVTDKVLALDFASAHLFDKAWLKYLYQKVLGADSQNKTATWATLKQSHERYYTISPSETVQDLEYQL